MNVLVAGLGKIAKVHIDALRALMPDSKVYALRSHRPSQEIDGVINIYGLDDNTTKFDFAIIANPSGLHAETIENLLHLNIPLFIEKPLFTDLGDGKLLPKLEGVTTYVGCNLRFLDCVAFLRRYMQSHPDERVNEVNVYCGSYLPNYRGENYRCSFNALNELGGGVHLDLIHDIDYVCYIFGLPDEVVGIRRNVSSLGIDAPDFAAYHLLYPRFTANVTLNYYSRQPKRIMEIVFENDVWTVDLRANTITDSRGATVYRGDNTVADTYTAQMRHFLDCVSGKCRSLNDASEAFGVLKICLA